MNHSAFLLRIACMKKPQSSREDKRQIIATDAQIDHLVYELYDLTPKEIAIVEQATKQ